jgi:nucleotide-binding universal stress UspA family protein
VILNIQLFGGKIMFNKILAPLDGSKLSECALEYVKEVATGCHVSEVVLLKVLEPFPVKYAEYSGSRTKVEENIQEAENLRKQAHEIAEQYLGKVKETLHKQGISVQSVVIQAEENKSAAEEILDYAKNNNVELIVMSTHGRSGITRWAFGSVTDRVVRHSLVPVLTVVPAGCRMESA